MGMNWLITDGLGFIGTALVKDLTSGSDHFFCSMDNLSFGIRENLVHVNNFVETDPNYI
jgi:UDP-glucose 4-epimerase